MAGYTDMTTVEQARQAGLQRLSALVEQRQAWTNQQYQQYLDEKRKAEEEQKRKAADYGSWGSKLKRSIAPTIMGGVTGALTAGPWGAVAGAGAGFGASMLNDSNPYSGDQGSINIDPYAAAGLASAAAGKFSEGPSAADYAAAYKQNSSTSGHTYADATADDWALEAAGMPKQIDTRRVLSKNPSFYGR